MEGWIKLHRKITDWEWYTDGNVFRVFVHLLLMANHEDRKWKGKLIKMGQRLTTVRTIANELKIDTKTVQRALKVLVGSETISIESSQKWGSLITIKKYEDYQLSVGTIPTPTPTLTQQEQVSVGTIPTPTPTPTPTPVPTPTPTEQEYKEVKKDIVVEEENAREEKNIWSELSDAEWRESLQSELSRRGLTRTLTDEEISKKVIEFKRHCKSCGFQQDDLEGLQKHITNWLAKVLITIPNRDKSKTVRFTSYRATQPALSQEQLRANEEQREAERKAREERYEKNAREACSYEVYLQDLAKAKAGDPEALKKFHGKIFQ